MDFRNIKINTRGYYKVSRDGTNQYGRVISTSINEFTIKFDNQWDNALYIGLDGKRDLYTFSSMATFIFLPHEFCLEDTVNIISGKYLGNSGLVYAYEGDKIMVDIEHNAISFKSNELELVARKKLI